MFFAILKNEFDKGYQNWENALSKMHIKYDVIDLTSNNWFKEINKQNYTGYLTCPPGRESHYKILYDERIYIIDKVLNKFVYPNFEEISIHENKKYLSYWLQAKDLPHPCTYVFYNIDEAKQFVLSSSLPIVGKFNIGESGSGVEIIKDKTNLEKYVEKMIVQGDRQRGWGPNLKMGGYTSRILNVIKNPSIIKNRLGRYMKAFSEKQKGFVILQDYVDHSFEWRIVKIGDSYFGHQKLKMGDKASGTKGINFTPPSANLLDFVKKVCDDNNFNSMAVDLFEDGKGGYLINEMQCIFGHVQEYICEVNGRPGRFVYNAGRWDFEEGLFNSNLSYDLRIKNVLSLLKSD
ncbi:MAG: hypothetical protein JJU02_12300 [Cryomorphaceae bacterium]|nr:hypothetical protein [Cryomorphaceae bacterium]